MARVFYDTEAFFQGRVNSRGFTFTNIPRPVSGWRDRRTVYGRFRVQPQSARVRIIITLPVPLWVIYALVWCPVISFRVVILLRTGADSDYGTLSVFTVLLLFLLSPVFGANETLGLLAL